ncbi:glycosyltransferase family 2 protein [Vibrio diabolicus]|uniref:glycosyltransferase family 2 protein n=1 Tax=Vibrio diabolicus TaxID=50719 RepID=UPI003752D1D3
MNTVKFSLILATLNPDLNLLRRTLESLKSQVVFNFEVIVVEQSQPLTSEELVNEYANFFPVRLVWSEKGLSRSRNAGVIMARGDYLLFPDDDCWYDIDFFYKLASITDSKKFGFITFRAANDENVDIAKFDDISGFCNKYNIWKRVSSISMCVRKTLFDDINGFDETLGLGSGLKTSACEDIELPLRAMERNIAVYYDSKLISRHDVPIQRDSKSIVERAKNHMYSVGYIYRTYKYSKLFVAYSVSKNIVALIINLLKLNPTMVKYYYYTANGKINGYFGGKRH